MEKTKRCMAALHEAAPEIEVMVEEPMRRHTTFAIGGPADLFVVPKTPEQLAKVLQVICDCGLPLLLLGNGSNMLVSDAGYRGAVVCTTEMDDVRAVAENRLIVQAGALLSRVSRYAQRAGLTGAEFAGGIPGSLGGAVFMNAGAYDGQMAGIVEQTEYLDGSGTVHTLTGEEHCFAYRGSAFRAHPDWVVLRSVLRLHYPSAGSTFKRPEGYFAGRLIEDAGLKGVSVGAAQVSEKHAGFLINRGGATCEEMLRLIELVQQRVREKFGVELECEVRIIR